MKSISTATASNNTSSSSTEDFSFKSEGIVWCSVFALEALLILVANMVTIFLFAVDKKLRKKSLFLVINMAFCDAMVGAASLPIDILWVGAKYQLWTEKLSSYAFLQMVQIVFLLASLISVFLISGERFYAISWPLKHRTLSMRAYHIVIFIAWISAILASMVLVLPPSNKLVVNSALSLFVLTLLIIVCGLNIGIWRRFHQGSMALQQQNRVLQNKRLTKTLSFVSIIACLSFLPINISFLISFFKVFIPSKLYLMTTFLCYSNSFFDPLVYALRIPEFKQALRLCCFRRRAVMNWQGNEGRDNRAAALAPVTQLRTLPTDLCHLQLAFKQEIIDTKVWSTMVCDQL